MKRGAISRNEIRGGGLIWPGALALGLLGLIVGGALAALLAAAPPFDLRALLDDAYLRRVVLFTIGQALASTLLACLELARDGKLELAQGAPFEEIYVRQRSEPRPPLAENPGA